MISPPTIAVLVHGGPESSEAARARGLAQEYPAGQVHYLWRDRSRRAAGWHWARQLKQLAPDLLYVINTANPGALVACWWRIRHRRPFVLDTGDAVRAMAMSAGLPAGWKGCWVGLVESMAQRLAHTIVVRGTRHREYLQQRHYPRVELIRDGYSPTAQSDSEAVAQLRRRLGLEGRFVVGVMGSLVYSPRLRICYGWDLVRALAQLRDLPVWGLVIGDGPGRGWLEGQARAQGVGDRLVFCGRVPYLAVPTYLRLLDVALSTQTNNLAGQVRTTGKLPEYMAAERFILASRVGEAALLLPEPMLLDYRGEVDLDYPGRLAGRLRELWHHPAGLEARRALPAIAAMHCSYSVLSVRFSEIVASVVPTTPGAIGARVRPALSLQPVDQRDLQSRHEDEQAPRQPLPPT